MSALPPLNGAKTHPLSAHALYVLRHLALRSEPRQELNPGVANRLLREGLVESFQATSPYATHAGKEIEHFRITDAGRAAIGKSQEAASS